MTPRCRAGQYLTLSLAGEPYLVRILGVREIQRAVRVTRVPRSPEGLQGVINLRGRVVPVVDLSVRFGLAPGGEEKRPCLIIVEAEPGEPRTTTALAADSVSEVVDLDGSALRAAPPFGTRFAPEFLLGLGMVRERFVPILDLERLLAVSALSGSAVPPAVSSGGGSPIAGGASPAAGGASAP